MDSLTEQKTVPFWEVDPQEQPQLSLSKSLEEVFRTQTEVISQIRADFDELHQMLEKNDDKIHCMTEKQSSLDELINSIKTQSLKNEGLLSDEEYRQTYPYLYAKKETYQNNLLVYFDMRESLLTNIYNERRRHDDANELMDRSELYFADALHNGIGGCIVNIKDIMRIICRDIL